jgi:hypothetical protein
MAIKIDLERVVAPASIEEKETQPFLPQLAACLTVSWSTWQT